MQTSRHSLLKTTAVLAGGVAGVVAGAIWAVAPRHDRSVAHRWTQICRYRYAHRGLHDISAGVPENSCIAFERARSAGFGCELDVHITSDNVPVVVHDSNLERVCDLNADVEDLTLEEVQNLALLGTLEHIPTLAEVLRIYEWRNEDSDSEPPAPLIIEFKPRENIELLCACAMEVFDEHNVRYVVESFDPRVLAWFREYRPEIIRGQLAENALARSHKGNLLCRAAQSALLGNALGRPDFVAYRFEDRHNPVVDAVVKGLGAHLVTWTIRTHEDLLTSEREGAPAIFEGFVPGPHPLM